MAKTDRRLQVVSLVLLTIAGVLLSSACRAEPGAAGTPLAILYAERPPFNITQPDGSVGGLVGVPAGNALRAAGIAFTWEALPTNRSVYEVQQNRRPVCGLGWYSTLERAQFARFSEPISQDGPVVAVIGRSFHGPRPASFETLTNDGQPS